jgi:hypothetical protein
MHAQGTRGDAMRKVITCRFASSRRRGDALRLLAATALVLALAPAHALGPREQAMDAALADGMTTAVGVAASSGVINPVGGLLTIATKAVTFHRASTLPESEQPAAYAAASAMWLGSAVSNACITAVFLSGGGFAPACLALGTAWGLKTWGDTEHERRFWERCAIVRQFAIGQEVECVYAPSAREAAAAPGLWREAAPRQSLAQPALVQPALVQPGPVQPPVAQPVLAQPARAQATPRRPKPGKRMPAPSPEPVSAPSPPTLVLLPGPTPEPAPVAARLHEVEAP